VANKHTAQRTTPSLNSSGAMLNNILPPVIERAHSSEWAVDEAIFKTEPLKELSKTN